jgi:2-C-methyl-D-erythritol 2,4-cyclodiphosphate synthase
LLHAICDALLGAAGLRDIGFHFPDNDPAYMGVSSLKLLAETHARVQKKGFWVSNIDATVVAQEPRLSGYIPKMLERISRALDLPPERVNIKATTTERLGFAGRLEGIAAYAVALLEENPA